MKKIILVLLIILGFSSFSDTFNHAVIQGLIEQEIGEVIVTRVYENLGHEIIITKLPGSRAAKESSSGKKDGEIMRIYKFADAFPTLIRVPTVYYSFGFTGFVRKDKNIRVNSKEDLKKYKVGYVRGVKVAADLSEGVKNVITVNDTEQLIKMVNAGRVDIGLVTDVDGKLAAKKFRFNNVVELEKPLLAIGGYHYVHEKNKAIVAELDAEIQRMKQTGELDKLVKEAEDTVFERHLK